MLHRAANLMVDQVRLQVTWWVQDQQCKSMVGQQLAGGQEGNSIRERGDGYTSRQGTHVKQRELD